MFSQILSVATLGKGALALSVVASAYGAGGLDNPEYRTSILSAHETMRPKTTPMPTLAVEHPAIAASEPTADAFASSYRSLLVPPAPKTEKPASTATPRTTKTTEPTTAPATVSFEALLSECVARYKRGATNTKEACDRAIAASGLSSDSFAAKYRSLLVPQTKTETPKPMATPKPTTAPKLDTSDPRVKECLAKYEALKTLKASGSPAFESALATFTQTCKTVLGMRG